MLSFKNIWTIAKYETKTLLRSWFFRIFAGLSLIVLTFMNVVFFTEAFDTMPWQFRGIPASIPYFNMTLLNLVQAIIAIFLASDFIKRDRKSNTTEVIYMRSMSNADYIFGKSLGLFYVFLGLNILMLLIAGVINVVFADVQFQFMPYIYYLLLISIPTLIYVFGLSFLVMSLIGNQAVTFLLLLGYFAISLVVLNVKVAAAFDSVGFFLPFAYSDFVGFGDLGPLLMQRLAYSALGLGFIFLSVLLFKRLPQSRLMQGVSRILTVVLIALGVFLLAEYVANARSGASLRQDMKALNDEYVNQPIADVLNYDISLQHNGDKINVELVMSLRNDNDADLADFLFSLNPGLTVKAVSLDGAPASFKRDKHLVSFQSKSALAPGQTAELKMQYSGSINEDACYIAASDEERSKLNQVMLYKLDKKSAFVGSDYVLLTSAAGWYPTPGVTHGAGLIGRMPRQFSTFTLRVSTTDSLTAISQGEATRENGMVVFKPETPLPQISLVIGPYKKRSITVDSVSYNLYAHPTHNYFEKYTNALTDTLAPLIREMKNDYELKTEVDYPFKSFSIVETPVSFKPLSTPLELNKDYVQPMQVFMPENGAALDAADFKRNIDHTQNRLQDRNQSMSDTEVQYQVFRRFIETSFFGMASFRRFGGPPSALEEGNFSVFANFYRFRNSIESRDMPLLNSALEAYLKSTVETSNFSFMRFRQAITDEEKAALKLNDSSFEQILSDPENIDIADDLLTSKSNYLFRLIESKVGKEKLHQFLIKTLAEHQFTAMSADDFLKALDSQLGVSMEKELQAWYSQKKLPGFYFSGFKNYKVLDGDRQKYQVIFTIQNMKDVDGVVVVDFLIPGGGGRGGFSRFNMGASDYQRAVFMPANRAKQIAIVADDQPRAVTINTLVSENLPSQSVHRFEKFEDNSKAKPLNVERLLDEAPEHTLPGEYIVDNEDDGFKVLTEAKKTPLQRLFKAKDNEEKYKPFSPWRRPQNWSNTINSLFYGELVHSAYYIRSGDGSKKVAWVVDLPGAGQYEVYSYGESLPMRGRGGRRGGGFVQEFHYSIYHDDGVEEVEWSSESAEGWNFLGSFYFSAGENKVELSNKSKGRIVTADAVKWVKK